MSTEAALRARAAHALKKAARLTQEAKLLIAAAEAIRGLAGELTGDGDSSRFTKMVDEQYDKITNRQIAKMVDEDFAALQAKPLPKPRARKTPKTS
jgi:hypothetical protein